MLNCLYWSILLNIVIAQLVCLTADNEFKIQGLLFTFTEIKFWKFFFIQNYIFIKYLVVFGWVQKIFQCLVSFLYHTIHTGTFNVTQTWFLRKQYLYIELNSVLFSFLWCIPQMHWIQILFSLPLQCFLRKYGWWFLLCSFLCSSVLLDFFFLENIDILISVFILHKWISLIINEDQVLAHRDEVRVVMFVLYWLCWTFLNVLEHHIQHSLLEWYNIVWFDIIFYIFALL